MLKTKEKNAEVKGERTEEVPQMNLQLAAYFHWKERGCPANDDLTDWLAVQKESSKGKTKKLS